MVGGDEEAVERVRPLFETFGKTIVRQGGPGAGQHTKMVNQIADRGHDDRRLRGAALRYKAGLDLETVLESVARRRGRLLVADELRAADAAGDFEPGFVVEHFVKDMGIALAEARRMNLSLPGLALAQQLYVALMAQGQVAREPSPSSSRSPASPTWTCPSVDVAHRQTLSPSSRRSNRSPHRWHVGGRICAGRAVRGGGRSRASPRERGARAA